MQLPEHPVLPLKIFDNALLDPVHPALQHGQEQHPPHYDKELGKARHGIENFFCRIKRFRRVATRYEQLPQTYLRFVTFSAIADWITSGFVHAA